MVRSLNFFRLVLMLRAHGPFAGDEVNAPCWVLLRVLTARNIRILAGYEPLAEVPLSKRLRHTCALHQKCYESCDKRFVCVQARA